MNHEPLNNYIRAMRKRAGLSQKQLSQLLGNESGSKVSRYERFRREPGLQTALACEVIFRTPVSDILAGVHAKVERRTLYRVRLMADSLRKKPRDANTARVISFLEELSSNSEDEMIEHGR